MWDLLALVKRRLVWFVAASMVLGLVNGYFFPSSYLEPFIIPLTVLMVYPMMVSMDLSAIFKSCSYKLQTVCQAINFIFIPLFAYGLGMLFFPEQPYMAFGLLLIALLPTSGMTISWTGFARGDTKIAVKMTIIGLIAGILLTPIYGYVLMGKVISIPLLKVVKQISLVILIPLGLGALSQVALRRLFGGARFEKDIKPPFPQISLLGVIGIIFVAMSLKAKTIIADPQTLVKLAIPLVILYLVNYTVATYVGRTFFPREQGVALVFGTVMRNLSIALAIAVTVFEEHGAQMAMIISLAYIFQIKSAALYIKQVKRLFGSTPEGTVSDVVTKGFFSLRTGSTMQDAVQLLDEEHIHAVAVLDEKDQPMGLLRSGDVINILAKGYTLETPVESVELQLLSMCSQQSTIHDAMKRMKRIHNYRCLVTDGGGTPIGILSESDIIHHLRGEKD